VSFQGLTPDDFPAWMDRPLPARPASRPSAVVIPCDSPEHADRLARLLHEMAAGGLNLTAADRVLLVACAKAEVQR